MKITPVIEMLTPAGLGLPSLRALVPNEDNYSVLLMQPRGQIEASAAGVRHQDRERANRQFRSFLDNACETNIDLAVTPEYSMPWTTLIRALKDGLVPNQGALWAFGCESIKYADLATIKLDLAPHATMLYEPLQPDPQRFVDPLTYVFTAPPATGNDPERVVLLVQFKTFPMGDNDHFEVNGLQRGTRIYQLGGTDSLRLVSLICSDALDFLDDDARKVYRDTLILHIQLNPKPHHGQFSQYRSRLMRFSGDTTEIICLNWARNVLEGCGDNARCWNNISGSAWYLRPDKFDDRDQTLTDNHRRGLYYTWLFALRSHALFFNYEQATFRLIATKVAHIGVLGSLARRRGPQLIATRIWDEVTSTWIDHMTPADGFSSIVAECGDAQKEVKRVADDNPFAAERILALCVGKIGDSDRWYTLKHLDSCSIDLSEVVRRITFCQDADAHDFRVARLRRCGRLWKILKESPDFPSALNDLRMGFRLEWNPASPHQNVISDNGQRATVIYLGEDYNESQIEAVRKRAAEYLGRTFSDPDQIVDARERLQLWYLSEDGQVELFDSTRYLNYDDSRTASEFDIAREK